jgi:hypothetical protein
MLCHDEDDQMVHSWYWYFLSRAREEDDVELLPAKGHDRMGCLPDQVKLTRALNQELDEAMKEIRHLDDLGEEASQRISEMESLCKQHEEAT